MTGLRKALKLHDTAFSGLAVDPVRQRVHVLTAGPGPVVHNLELDNEAVSYLGNSTIFEEIPSTGGSALVSASNGTCTSPDASCVLPGTEPERHELRNVWNLAAWENSGMLLAITPRDSGFNTSVLVVDPVSGRAVQEQTFAK